MRKYSIPDGYELIFVRSYKHYRTGKIMNAEEYGHKAWPIFFLRKIA